MQKHVFIGSIFIPGKYMLGHGWRFDPGFTAKSVKKIFRGENEHWEFLDISFLG